MEHENDILTVEKVEKTTDDNWTYVQKKQSSNQTIKQEYKEFSDFSHAKKPKDYEEYEIIQTYTPKKKAKKNTAFQDMVREQNSYEADKETVIYEKVKPQKKLKRTSKIFVCICCAIAVLMGTLGIINTVKINNLNFSNISKAEEIANVGKELVKIDQAIEGITSEDAVKDNAQNSGMESVTTTEKIELIEKNNVVEHQGKTSLFDKICNFIIHFFGG